MQRTRVMLLQCLLSAITGLAAMSGMQASAATLCVKSKSPIGLSAYDDRRCCRSRRLRGHDQRRPRPLCRRRAYYPTGLADRGRCTMDDHQRQGPLERHLYRRHQRRRDDHPRRQHADQCDGHRVYRAKCQFRGNFGAQCLQCHVVEQFGRRQRPRARRREQPLSRYPRLRDARGRRLRRRYPSDCCRSFRYCQ